MIYGIDTSGKNRRTKKQQEEEAQQYLLWQDQYYELDFQKGQELLMNKMWPYLFDCIRCQLPKFTRGNGNVDEYIEAAAYGADIICKRYTSSKKRIMRNEKRKKDPYKKDHPVALCWWMAKNAVYTAGYFSRTEYDKLNYEDLDEKELYNIVKRY